MLMGSSTCLHRSRSAEMPDVRHEAASGGFTLLEMIMVMFLLGGVLVLVIPRIVVGEDLGSTGRAFISALRSLQGMAVTTQRPVKLYIDLDQGTYWVMVMEGKEEKLPPDASWLTRRSLPEAIRFTDISVGPTRRMSGRVDLSIFPNGRIGPLTVHFKDENNNVLGIAVEPLTGAIRTSDERIEPPRNQPIPERIRILLQPTGTGLTPAAVGIKLQ